MTTFDFITSEEFRASLEADFQEMNTCMASEAWKAVHVLAGSIIEAVLSDYLHANEYVTRDEALNMDFGKAINLCKDKKIISAKTADLSSVIKSYRNLIHPGRLIRLNESVDASSARVAQALVTIVLNEIAREKRKTYGYTAEQIVAKLERDSSASVILSHILKTTNKIEIERLLISVLPERYLLYSEEEFFNPHLLTALEACFKSAFDLASPDLKKKVTERFVTVLKEEREEVVFMYETAFLRMPQLEYLTEEERDLIIQHILSRLKKDTQGTLLPILSGIGHFIKEKDVTEYVDPLVRLICSNAKESVKNQASACLTREWLFMKREVDQKVIQRLDDWINHFTGKGLTQYTDKLQSVKGTLDDIPF